MNGFALGAHVALNRERSIQNSGRRILQTYFTQDKRQILTLLEGKKSRTTIKLQWGVGYFFFCFVLFGLFWQGVVNFVCLL